MRQFPSEAQGEPREARRAREEPATVRVLGPRSAWRDPSWFEPAASMVVVLGAWAPRQGFPWPKADPESDERERRWNSALAADRDPRATSSRPRSLPGANCVP